MAAGAVPPAAGLSGNSPLARKKKGWIDLDAGRLLDGESLDTLADELVTLVLDTASGKLSRNEENGYHDIAIFKTGVTL